jgi:hypothetical protein
MDAFRIWKIIEEAWIGLTERFEPLVEKRCLEAGIESRLWGLLLAVYTFEPDDTTPAHLLVRSPYTAAEAYLKRLDKATKMGFLSEVEPGRFRMTEGGRALTFEIADVARQVMAHSDPLLPVDSGGLAILLDRLVQSCLNTPPPPDTWSIRLSFKLMPRLNPPMPFIEQAFSCLAAYREDSHLAAWQQSGLSAMALETLTLLWRGEVSSVDDLCRKLEHRGHPCDVYANVLVELRERGLITGPEKAPWVTGTGRVFRNDIEEKTDELFFVPWKCLNAEEMTELFDLVSRLRGGLK